MNPQGTSFIPQRPTQGKVKHRGVRKIYVLTYVSYVLFFGSVITAGATFFYSNILEGQLDRQKNTLIAERAKFDESDMGSIRQLDNRLNTARQRMDMHISVPSIFTALEDSAVQSLQFVSFSYKRDNDLAPLIALTGTSDNTFNSILFQREVLQTNPILSGATFTEVALGATSNTADEGSVTQNLISFELTKEVDPSLIKYVPSSAVRSFEGFDQTDTMDASAEEGFEDEEQISEEAIETDFQ